MKSALKESWKKIQRLEEHIKKVIKDQNNMNIRDETQIESLTRNSDIKTLQLKNELEKLTSQL